MRIVLALALGISVGSAATYLAVRGSGLPADPQHDPGAPAAPARAPAAIESRAASLGMTAERAAFYARVAAAGRPELETLAQEAAALATAEQRRFQLDAVLGRYLEVDPNRALRTAGELQRRLGLYLVGPLYEK